MNRNKLFFAFASFSLLFCAACKEDDIASISCGNPLINWDISSVPLASIERQHDIFFPDVNTGYTVGDNATILKTTDGGASWETLHSGAFDDHLTSLNLRGVCFLDAQIGFVAGNRKGTFSGEEAGKGAILLKTRDGGNSWEKHYLENIRIIYDLVFFDENNGTGLFSIDEGDPDHFHTGIVTTTDGGLHWTEVSVPVPDVDSNPFIQTSSSLLLKDQDADGNPLLLKSTDRGLHWKILPMPLNHSCSGLYFLNDSIGFAALASWTATEGAVFQTRDGGHSWQPIQSPFQSFHFMHFKNEQEAFVINPVFDMQQTFGDWGWPIAAFEVFQTTNGGQTWTKKEIDKNCDFTGISCTPSRDVVITLGRTINRFEAE